MAYGVKPPSFFEKFKPNQMLFNTLINTKRQMLNAFSLHFLHPFTGEEIHLKADLPDDFKILLSLLQNL